ncbi:hypothetical protein CON64_17795 [Bacillus pseudomycoides]|nr:hypothetical protein CON64_17795 [Bacillus pseudomycoides]
MEINRITIGNKTLEPIQQPSNFDKQEVTVGKQKDTITFAIDHHIVTRGEEIGIILSNVHDGEVAVQTILNELKSVIQLLQQLPKLLEEKSGQNEQMYQEIVKNVQELVKNIHVRQIPLLDGTYDFIELPITFQLHDKKMMIPLLDMVALTHLLGQDPSKIEMVIQTITAYMTKVSNGNVFVDAFHPASQERDVGVLRALAEMSMTQLSQQMKQLVKEHKWSITVFFLLIWVICIYVIQR